METAQSRQSGRSQVFGSPSRFQARSPSASGGRPSQSSVPGRPQAHGGPRLGRTPAVPRRASPSRARGSPSRLRGPLTTRQRPTSQPRLAHEHPQHVGGRQRIRGPLRIEPRPVLHGTVKRRDLRLCASHETKIHCCISAHNSIMCFSVRSRTDRDAGWVRAALGGRGDGEGWRRVRRCAGQAPQFGGLGNEKADAQDEEPRRVEVEAPRHVGGAEARVQRGPATDLEVRLRQAPAGAGERRADGEPHARGHPEALRYAVLAAGGGLRSVAARIPASDGRVAMAARIWVWFVVVMLVVAGVARADPPGYRDEGRPGECGAPPAAPAKVEGGCPADEHPAWVCRRWQDDRYGWVGSGWVAECRRPAVRRP